MKKDIAYNFLVIGFALIAIAFIVFLISIYSNFANNQFISEGIVAEATVTKLKKEKVFSGKLYQDQYSIDLMFFAKTIDSEKRLGTDSIIINPKTGKLISANVVISEGLYEKIKRGDKISIIYIAENPEEVRLQELVEAFNIKAGIFIVSIIFCIGLLFVALGYKKQVTRKIIKPGQNINIEKQAHSDNKY